MVTTGPAVLVLNEHAAAVVAIGGQDVCGICRYRYLGVPSSRRMPRSLARWSRLLPIKGEVAGFVRQPPAAT